MEEDQTHCKVDFQDSYQSIGSHSLTELIDCGIGLDFLQLSYLPH